MQDSRRHFQGNESTCKFRHNSADTSPVIGKNLSFKNISLIHPSKYLRQKICFQVSKRHIATYSEVAFT